MKKSEKQEYIIPESDLILLEVEAYVCTSPRATVVDYDDEEDVNLYN